MILYSLVHQLGEIALPMVLECVDDQQVHTGSVIARSTILVTHIPEFVEKLLDINLDILTPSFTLNLLIRSMLME